MTRPELIERALTEEVIGAFYEVYNTFGYGLLEQVYVAALAYELRLRGHTVTLEAPVVVTYKGVVVSRQRIDVLVDERVVVEVKSTERLAPTASRQLYNYLRATRLQVGLLLHFGPDPRPHRIMCSPKRSDGDALDA